jgi:hypothetical protein
MHTQARLATPRAQELFGGWAELAKAPFSGITTEGRLVPDLFSLQPSDAPTPAMVAAATALLARVSPAQRQSMLCRSIRPWRGWQNTELYVRNLRAAPR